MQARADEWAACLITNTRKFAAMNEGVELTVDAAFGQCTQYEWPVHQALQTEHMAPYIGMVSSFAEVMARASVDADRSFAALRSGYRGKMIGLVMEERAAAGPQPKQ